MPSSTAAGWSFETQPSLPKGVLLADIDPGNVELLAEVGTIVLAMPASLKKKVARIGATSAERRERDLDQRRPGELGDVRRTPR